MVSFDPLVLQGLQKFWDFLNSEFVAALLGALAGALAGAYGGQHIVERQALKKLGLEELRRTNAAISLATFVLNATVTMQRQHLRGMIAAHRAEGERFEAMVRAGGTGTYKFQADWQILPLIELPLVPLREAIYSRMDADSPVVLMFANLDAVCAHLATATELRNSIIREVQSRPTPLTTRERLQLYFGIPQASGIVDERYPSSLNAMGTYASDASLFAAILAALLIEHGKAEAKKLGKGAPKVRGMGLKAAFTEGLIPEPSEYETTLRGIGIDPDSVLAAYR